MKKVDQFRFRILDNSPEGVILLDTHYRIIYLNRMIERWTGFILEAVEGQPITELFPHMAKPAYYNRLKQVFENGFPLVLSAQLHPDFLPSRRRGKPLIGQTTISRVEESDTSGALLRISLMDMTVSTTQYAKIVSLQQQTGVEIAERKHAEAALLKEREALQEANAAKDKFFSILAHDLRGPLGGMVSMSETMLDQFDLFDKDELKDIVRIMNHSSSQVFDLLKNLLTWSRLNTGRMDWQPALTRIKPLVNDLAGLFQVQIVEKELALEISCPDSILVYADQAMLETVLRNLLSNALKFTPRGGRIQFSCAEQVETHQTVLQIQDTGVGMRPEVLEQVFDISSKYHTPGTENEASSGLGLVLVKEFVERNQGHLSIESEPGVGSLFTCIFPSSAQE